jgi:hypothetical protein
MLGWIKYLRKVRVETDALKRNKDLASTRTSLVRDEGDRRFKILPSKLRALIYHN